jgi:hypothetical protein
MSVEPVAAAAEPQPGGGVGAGFLGVQPAAFGLLGDVGGQVFEHPVPEPAQLAGPELGGLLDQVGLGLDQHPVRQVPRQLFPGVGDGADLGQVHGAGREGLLDLYPAAVEVGG